MPRPEDEYHLTSMQNSGNPEPSALARRLSRRNFLRGSALAGAGLGLAVLPASGESWAGSPRIRRWTRLGDTELSVPDVGFGTFALRGDVALVRHALDRGITHFDTAESYTDGEAERTLGRALGRERQDVTITSKYVAAADDTVARQMAVLEESLRRLRTDYIDIYFNHAVNDLARLRSPAWQEFVQRAKEQGKIRFAGMSGHGPHLAECLDYALAHELVDVILVAYNFSQDPGFRERMEEWAWKLGASLELVAPQQRLPDLLQRAHDSGVGVMTMKTLKGARRNDMRPFETGGATFAQAALRWVLSNPNVDALVVTMKSREMVDEYVLASGWQTPTPTDLSLLRRYESMNARSQCQPGCDACASSCPRGVPISDVLRARMYDADYEEPELARAEYAKLGFPGSACVECSTLDCVGVCPSQLPIPELTRDTHRRLIETLRE